MSEPQFTFLKLIYKDLTPKQIKQIKQLLRSTTGERLITAQPTDPIYLTYDKGNKLIGHAMISSYSPEKHFSPEGPYLYNFITDTSLAKHKRCGRYLLAYIENDLIEHNNTLINLDVECNNVRAFKFFALNKYKVIGRYEKLDLRNMNLYEVDKTIRNYSLQDKVDEIKTRRGLKTEENDIVSLTDDAPNKKIIYVSMTKALNARSLND